MPHGDVIEVAQQLPKLVDGSVDQFRVRDVSWRGIVCGCHFRVPMSYRCAVCVGVESHDCFWAKATVNAVSTSLGGTSRIWAATDQQWPNGSRLLATRS